jgi:hypothetical protein
MDGTVNCAKREDGRPALAGTAAADGTNGACAVLAEGVETGIGLFSIGTEVALAGALAGAFPAAAVTARAGTLDWDLATGLACVLPGAFTAGLTALLDTDFSALADAVLEAGLATGLLATLATGLVTVLAAGLAAGLTNALDCAEVDLTLLSFPELAFTACLLAGLSCPWFWGSDAPPLFLKCFSGGVSTARECTGKTRGKPISCKIETII